MEWIIEYVIKPAWGALLFLIVIGGGSWLATICWHKGRMDAAGWFGPLEHSHKVVLHDESESKEGDR